MARNLCGNSISRLSTFKPISQDFHFMVREEAGGKGDRWARAQSEWEEWGYKVYNLKDKKQGSSQLQPFVKRHNF
jgi:hypothetical protein